VKPALSNCALHHVGGRDNISSGSRVRYRRLSEPFERDIVVDVLVRNFTAMSMACVFAVANVCDQQCVRHSLLDCAQGSLNDAVVRVRARRHLVLLGRNSEKNDSADAKIANFATFFNDSVDRKLRVPGHRRDVAPDVLTFADEEGKDEVGSLELGFANKRAQGFRAAQAAHSVDRKWHG
jgi:hypothetical protein